MATPYAMTRIQKNKEKDDAIQHLKEIVKPLDTVYTLLRKVSSNGMSRHISTLVVKDGKILDITWYVAKAIGAPLAKDGFGGGMRIGGCGMDMGFHVVYSLTSVLELRKTYQEHERDEVGNCYGLEHRWL